MTTANTHSAQHPDQEALEAYARTPQNSHGNEIALHLAQCPQCRAVVAAFTHLKTHGHDIPIPTCPAEQQQQVDELVYEHPSPARRQQLLDTLKTQPAALLSALFSLANQPPLSAPAQTAPAAKRSGKSLPARLQTWFSVLTPARLALPATAFSLVLAAFVAGQYWNSLAPDDVLVSYQDDPGLYFLPAKATPGIGFFSAARQRKQSFGGMQIVLRDNQLTLNWPAIDQAVLYRLQLNAFIDGQQQSLQTVESTAPSVTVELPANTAGHRFEWTLSGTTASQEQFYSRGGFITRKNNHD